MVKCGQPASWGLGRAAPTSCRATSGATDAGWAAGPFAALLALLRATVQCTSCCASPSKHEGRKRCVFLLRAAAYCCRCCCCCCRLPLATLLGRHFAAAARLLAAAAMPMSAMRRRQPTTRAEAAEDKASWEQTAHLPPLAAEAFLSSFFPNIAPFVQQDVRQGDLRASKRSECTHEAAGGFEARMRGREAADGRCSMVCSVSTARWRQVLPSSTLMLL